MAKNSIFTYDTLVHATAGATGSIVATSVMFPLETIKFRLQLEDYSLQDKTVLEALTYILRTEGIEGLYRGMRPVLASLGVSNFIYFYTFHGLKSLQIRKFGNRTQTDLILSTIAGIVNVLLTNPLWVVNNRLKINSANLPYSNLIDGIVHVAKTEGVKSLWSSVGPSLLLVVNPAIHFTVYEALKRRIAAKTALEYFMIGAVAKIISTIVTYPLQIAQTQQRCNSNGMNTAALLLNMIKKNGPSALYQGLEAKLLQTVLASALMFMTYEKIAQFVFTLLTAHKQRSK